MILVFGNKWEGNNSLGCLARNRRGSSSNGINPKVGGLAPHELLAGWKGFCFQHNTLVAGAAAMTYDLRFM